MAVLPAELTAAASSGMAPGVAKSALRHEGGWHVERKPVHRPYLSSILSGIQAVCVIRCTDSIDWTGVE